MKDLPLAEIQEWKKLLERPIVDPERQRSGFAQRLFWQCSSSNFEELIEHLKNDDEQVRAAALDCLDWFIGSRYDQRWREDRRNRVSESLKQMIIKQYPTRAGRGAYHALLKMNRAEAESFLLSFPADRFPAPLERDAFTSDLALMRDGRAKSVAQKLKENWQLSRLAASNLELVLNRAQPFPADVTSAALTELDYKPVASLDGPLVNSACWERYLHVLRNDPSPFARTYIGTCLPLLTDGDIRDVAQLLLSAAEDLKDGALLVLMVLAEGQNGRLQRISEALRNVLYVARTAYLKTANVPVRAFFTLLAINNTAATLFLLNDVTYDDLNAGQKRQYIEFLGMCKNNQAMYRLKQISKSDSSDDRSRATSVLEMSGQVAPGKLEEMAEHWRRAKDVESLNWLYHNYITRLTVDTPLHHIKKVLGEPSQIHKNCVYYISKEGPSLYLEINAANECTAWTLK